MPVQLRPQAAASCKRLGGKAMPPPPRALAAVEAHAGTTCGKPPSHCQRPVSNGSSYVPRKAASLIQARQRFISSPPPSRPFLSEHPAALSAGESSTARATDEPSVGILSLKEWALACAALRNGDQTVLLRKGGLKDPCFKPKGSTFALFPTAFHNTRELVTDGAANKYSEYLDFELGEVLELDTLATLTGCWTTESPEVLQLTSDFHVWSDGLLSTRMKWKPSQPLTVMEMRCWKLPSPLRIPMIADYKGCFSWVHLQADTGMGSLMDAASPVMDDHEFQRRQQKLRDQLALLHDLVEQPIPAA